MTAARPGREFAFDVGAGQARWRYTLAPVDDRCRVTESFKIVRVPGALDQWLTKLATGVSWTTALPLIERQEPGRGPRDGWTYWR